MNGTTRIFLDLVAVEAVGASLLDPRPALVFAGDGTRILWANVAGAQFFGSRGLGDLLGRRLTSLNPLKAQIGRLARLLPADRSRLEILRVGFGVSLAALPAACRRLNLADGTTAVLAIGAGGGPAESLATRAERLADAIADQGCLAAVLDATGRVLGASAGLDDPALAQTASDGLIAAVAEADGRRVERPIAIGHDQRLAGVARFSAGARDCYLVIVGAAATAGVSPERETTGAATATAADGLPSDIAEKPMVAPEPAVRFVWQADGDRRFTFVSREFATAVGAGNAAVVGKTWEEIAAILDVDADGAIGAAFGKDVGWAATVYWPVAGGDRIAVDLAAIPVHAAGADHAGFRGFGICRADDRRPDERREAISLADAGATASAAAQAEVTKAAAIVEREPAPDRPREARSDDDLDDAARKSVEEGRLTLPPRARRRVEPVEPAEPAIGAAASNIVRLPGAPPPAPTSERLTGTEQDAFRRIAEALAAGKRGGEPATTPGTGRSSELAQPPAVRAPTAPIDSRLLDRVPVGLAVTRDHKTLFANRALLELLGYDSFDQFAAAGGVEAIFPDRAGTWAADRLGEAGSLAARRRDGGTVAVEVRLHAVQWGAASALMLTISPTGARAEDSEEALTGKLAAAEARAGELAAILDTATDGVIVVDGAGAIGSMNRAAEALFGVDAGGLIGRHFTDLLAEESSQPALDYLDGLAANGVASVLNDGREVIGKVPRGGLIPLFMTMGRIGGSDKFCAVLRDITHWKNVEEALTAARRAAEVANAHKSEFLAKVSHEIRTPLTAIIGFSELMMEERFGPIGNDRYRSYLSDINVSGAHLMSLINDLLDLSKIEAGKLELSFESVPINAVIQECVALMQPQANRHRIIIRTSLSVDVPNIVADRRSFRQILLNLMSNAIKFTRPGGQVIVSTALEESGEVVVRIRDTGIGMSEKDVETAMRPFRQVAAAADGGDRGTGLGLPLTKALVEANRASFAIDSAIDQGTLVKITFPTTRVLAG